MVFCGEAKEAVIEDEGVLSIKERVCVPRVEDLTHNIYVEAYNSRYSIHPSATKMHHDLRHIVGGEK